MSEKPKRGSSNKSVLRKSAFFFLWMLLPLAVSFLSQPVFDWVIRFIDPNWGVLYPSSYASWRADFVASMVFAILTIPAEKTLLRLGSGKWVRGWISGGLLGAIGVSLLYIYLQQNRLAYVYANEPVASLFFLLTATIYLLPRAWVLRRYVKRSWAYFLAMILGFVIQGRVIDLLLSMEIDVYPFSSLIASTISGLVLLWLFRQTPPVEKAKVEEASARLEDKIADETETDETEESEGRSSIKEAIYAFYRWIINALHQPRRGRVYE
jgi:hypothetical protein